MEASHICANRDPEALIEPGELEQHDSDHWERVSLPSADSDVGHEGGVCSNVEDAIWVSLYFRVMMVLVKMIVVAVMLMVMVFENVGLKR